MESQPYSGPTGAMRDSPWLAKEDIEHVGADVPVTIESVWQHTNVTFDQGRTEPVKFSLKFQGKDKQLIINATNRATLRALFGSITGDWVGQQISLYVDPNVKMKGKRVGGIRIRNERSEASRRKAEALLGDS